LCTFKTQRHTHYSLHLQTRNENSDLLKLSWSVAAVTVTVVAAVAVAAAAAAAAVAAAAVAAAAVAAAVAAAAVEAASQHQYVLRRLISLRACTSVTTHSEMQDRGGLVTEPPDYLSCNVRCKHNLCT
jgi:hypothetical protein